jgi:hypothetical protein
VGVQGPTSKQSGLIFLSHFPKRTFISKITQHRDVVVISCVIKGFVVYNILVDTGSASDIIFPKFFKQMEESKDKIQDSTYPFCGLGGQQVLALRKLAMPIPFSYVNNTRIEEVVFEIVDMKFP